MALRLAKWISPCARWAWQSMPPVQRATASPASRSTALPHTGQVSGSLNGSCSGSICSPNKSTGCIGRRSNSTRTTSGITSPARRTTTVSPTRTSLRATSSWLCSVALVTVTPPTNTGASRATGVTAPVRPTCTSIASTVVSASSAGNLCAIAQRGARDTKPSCCCSANEFTLTTMPSISYGRRGRCSASRSYSRNTAAAPVYTPK